MKPKAQINIKLDDDQLKALKVWCVHNSTNVTEVIVQLIEKFLSENVEEEIAHER